ncbi:MULTISPECIES: DUF6291 domain-containing protein [unclassified Clostridium]|uniref:DUF6291 domain-containing protein n=1 Tax=unclassified Clostridium TaxID=2614128 RepID=UPI000E4FAA96|nr:MULTISPECIES: DUF6291 domain-containing protein [unclassified Clostridium]RHP94199.1 hypothetical protein DXA07_04490 [Clostridium sp. AM54-37XD]RHS54070.1 hypothetical protein DW959_04295 [Clostridium sp. AM46-21]
MSDKKSFVFYTEYREHLEMLPPEQIGELMLALIDYQETGEVPDLPKGSALAMCFSFIKKRMDKDNIKYEEKCERNKENGKKGGRPAKEPVIEETDNNPKKPNGFSENRTVIEETDNNPTEPRKADNEYDSDNEYDNDCDNEEYIHTPEKICANAHTKKAVKSHKKPDPVVYSDVPELDEAIHEFIKFRKGMKKPMSDRAVTLMMNKLETLSHDKYEQVQILNQSIMQGWTGVYELKGENKQYSHSPRASNNRVADQLDESYKMMADWAKERAKQEIIHEHETK